VYFFDYKVNQGLNIFLWLLFLFSYLLSLVPDIRVNFIWTQLLHKQFVMFFQFLLKLFLFWNFVSVSLKPFLDFQASRRMLVGNELKWKGDDTLRSFLKFQKYSCLNIVNCVLFISFSHPNNLSYDVCIVVLRSRVDKISNKTSLDKLFKSSWVKQINNFVSCQCQRPNMLAQITDGRDSFKVEISRKEINIFGSRPFWNFSFFFIWRIPFLYHTCVIDFICLTMQKLLFSFVMLTLKIELIYFRLFLNLFEIPFLNLSDLVFYFLVYLSIWEVYLLVVAFFWRVAHYLYLIIQM